MTYLKTWEDFERTAVELYQQNSVNVRFVLKYDHSTPALQIKITDNVVCLQYKTELSNELRKMEKLISKLVNHMACKEV